MATCYAVFTTSHAEPRRTRSCSTASWASYASSTRRTSRTSTSRRSSAWNEPPLIRLGGPRQRRGPVADRAHQHFVARVLQHATCAEGPRDVADLRVERVHHNSRVRELARDPLEHLYAPTAGHLVVEDDNIRHELLAGADGLLRIARHADAVHVTLGVHEIAKVLAHRRMIVHDQDADPSPKHWRQSRSSRAASAMSISGCL